MWYFLWFWLNFSVCVGVMEIVWGSFWLALTALADDIQMGYLWLIFVMAICMMRLNLQKVKQINCKNWSVLAELYFSICWITINMVRLKTELIAPTFFLVTMIMVVLSCHYRQCDPVARRKLLFAVQSRFGAVLSSEDKEDTSTWKHSSCRSTNIGQCRHLFPSTIQCPM